MDPVDPKQARFEAALNVLASASTGLTADEFQDLLEDETKSVMASYQQRVDVYNQEVKNYQFHVDDYAKNPTYRGDFPYKEPEPPKSVTFDKVQAQNLVKLLSDFVEQL